MRHLPLATLAVLATLTAYVPPSPAAVRANATLTATEGQVQSRTQARPQWHPAPLRETYAPGDTLRTGRVSRAQLSYLDGTVTRLAPYTVLRVVQKQGSFARLLLGRLWFKIAPQHGPIRIETPGAVAAVVGTELLVAVDTQETTHVTCIEGHVSVSGDKGAAIPLAAGQWTDIVKGAAPNPPTPFNWNRLKASEILLQPLKQSDAPAGDDEDPDDIWK